MPGGGPWDKWMGELRRPFTPAAVKFKPLTKPREGKSSAAFYIDARLVAERLNEVVGPELWSDEYTLVAEGSKTPALYYPIVCRLTVAGVTKSDVGQGANTVLDEKAWKSAYSDALKRAAVKFGIGAYLYAIPRLWAAVDIGQDGKVKGFTREGRAFLLNKYQGWLASPLNTFGDPLDHGDVDEDDDGNQASRATPPQPANKGATPDGSGTVEPSQGSGAASPPKTAANQKNGPTADQLAHLFKLVEERGGDVQRTSAGYDTAVKQGKVADWYAKAFDHWSKAPVASEFEKKAADAQQAGEKAQQARAAQAAADRGEAA